MKSNGCKFVDLCFSDSLACSRSVKGAGIGACVKDFRGKIIVCPRWYGASVSFFLTDLFSSSERSGAMRATV